MATKATRRGAGGGRQAAANARARNPASGPRTRGVQPSAAELNTAARSIKRITRATASPTEARAQIRAMRA